MISEDELKALGAIIENAVKNVNLIKIKALARASAVIQFIAFITFAIKSILNFSVQDVFLAILFLALSMVSKAIGGLATQALGVKVLKERPGHENHT